MKLQKFGDKGLSCVHTLSLSFGLGVSLSPSHHAHGSQIKLSHVHIVTSSGRQRESRFRILRDRERMLFIGTQYRNLYIVNMCNNFESTQESRLLINRILRKPQRHGRALQGPGKPFKKKSDRGHGRTTIAFLSQDSVAVEQQAGFLC